jgi:hypothetical protein
MGPPESRSRGFTRAPPTLFCLVKPGGQRYFPAGLSRPVLVGVRLASFQRRR